MLLFLPTPQGQVLRSILSGALEASMIYTEQSNIDTELAQAIVDASMSLLVAVSDVLKACPTPGREHYLFNMRTIITILQVNNISGYVNLWLNVK